MKVADNRDVPLRSCMAGTVVEVNHSEYEAATPHIVTTLSAGGATCRSGEPRADREVEFDEVVLIQLETGKTKCLPREYLVRVLPEAVLVLN